MVHEIRLLIQAMVAIFCVVCFILHGYLGGTYNKLNLHFYKIPFDCLLSVIQPLFLCPVEWHALYTSQITKKAKKYHNRILKMSDRGSFQMQVRLNLI